MAPSSPQAEFAALYLPSLLRTLFNNPIQAFEALGRNFVGTYTSVVRVHVPSQACSRFVREHPEEVIEVGVKALRLLIDYFDRMGSVSYRLVSSGREPC